MSVAVPNKPFTLPAPSIVGRLRPMNHQVGAVGAAQAVFDLENFAFLLGLFPAILGPRGIFRMDDRLPAAATGLLEGEAGVFIPAPVEVVGHAGAVVRPDELRHRIGQRLQALFGGLQVPGSPIGRR